MSPEKMVHMANQIATFFKSQPGDATEKVASHIGDFWEPRMRDQLRDYVNQGGAGLDRVVVEAAALVR
ncbi:formate dehydrogenase subunit delta [Sedimentitalea sp. JM2-8]|uniref:Formate dehydrogenase subunit delta n=1 Tax=Sedimentitalea xiamensis TaxID=3050037 RepID=A0ABT7FF00_9RHOB|nr:formate dehydrogenase subunit delta [Sedimentitalea xiamensis]MDK3073563.1 formate dehydrogenase subunit delta [Sedimentitalea xiamensis]